VFAAPASLAARQVLAEKRPAAVAARPSGLGWVTWTVGPRSRWHCRSNGRRDKSPGSPLAAPRPRWPARSRPAGRC